EVWPYLAAGASLHLPDEATLRAPSELVRWFTAARVDIAFAPTPLAEALLGEAWPEGAALRVLLTGGDRRRRRPQPGARWRLVNHYGPTEHTVVATCADVAATETGDGRESAENEEGKLRLPSIGRGIANTRLYVLDEGMEPVPVGVAGELYLGGESVARGYVGDARETADRFVPDPFSAEAGARLYRTGDICRWIEGGELEYVGRRDGQVKVRGYRIEKGEVEAALRESAGVREAAVEVVEEGGGDRRLVAYVEWEGGVGRSVEGLRGGLRERLPEYMVPSRYVWVEEMPVTPNGKLDRKALSLMQLKEAPVSAAKRPVRGGVERAIADAWRETLGVEEVGGDDNFFDLGGHSLAMVRVFDRLRERLGGERLARELTLVEMFEHPTVRALARRLSWREEEGAEAAELREAAGARASKQRRAHRRHRRPPASDTQVAAE
ncbi:MAG TPA: non-ribosomal peptide synthetase, partial [Pyrinomonadaceae bacterium]|nr:non-ribosomal peptide synthetase [Pyrinomonadaceae bacterium]